jgi:hypothetical protein
MAKSSEVTIYLYSQNQILSDLLESIYKDLRLTTKMYKEQDSLNKDPVCILEVFDHDEKISVNRSDLPKPFRVQDFIKIIDFEIAQLKSENYKIGGFSFIHNLRILSNNNETIHLTDKESAILYYLLSKGDFVSREELLSEVWGYGNNIDTKTLETHIYKLRQKIPFNEELIIVRDNNYCIVQKKVAQVSKE